MTSAHTISTFSSANKVSDAVTKSLENVPRPANVILPKLNKSKMDELKALRKGKSKKEDQHWVVCSTNETIELVLSCTNNGSLGAYPIFIVATDSSAELSRDYLLPRVRGLIDGLLNTVSTRRVYSVFAHTLITDVFVELWTERTGIRSIPEPYYDSWMSYCTKDTFVDQPASIPADASYTYDIRPANDSDIDQVAELCYQFAEDCPPFILTRERAREEAAALVKKRQLWVHRINEGGASDIASICALTRTGDEVATITKVYTNPNFRGRRCAERLVRRVCNHLFTATPNKPAKRSIVLYVGVNNLAAKVYNRVGFVGLTNESPKPVGVERWVEIGFDQSKVDLGHW